MTAKMPLSSHTPCVHKQPNATHCFVCGTENPNGLKLNFYDDGDSTVESRFTLTESYQGYPGIAHGGVLAAILDEVVGRVSMVDDHHHFMMTVNMALQYRNPAPINTELVATGVMVKSKGRLCKAKGQIRLPDGVVACDAELTLIDMPASMATNERHQQLGWRVVPD